jgi:oxygen-dependent protoporphyrinogen oxidase
MKVTVLGAGIGGLATAFSLKKKGHEVIVIDEAAQPGGVIHSEKIDGHLLEYGPNTVMPTPELLALIHELKLSNQVRWANPKLPRYVQINGELKRVPFGVLSLLGKLRFAMEPLVFRSRNTDETLFDFAKRRLGREAAERLVEPFVSGIWAGDAHTLSAAAAFPKLAKWENEHGSLLRGFIASRKERAHLPKGLLSFRDGFQTLPNAIGASFGESLRLNEEVQEIARDSKERWSVRTSRGLHTSDALVAALPAKKLAALFQPVSPTVAETLAQIPHAGVTLLHLTMERPRIGHSLYGFGYLVAPSEQSPLLGCIWSSTLFSDRAPAGHALLTAFAKPGADTAHVLKELAHTLQFDGEPTVLSEKRYDAAIPQYTMGHAQRVAILSNAEKELTGLRFVGSYVGGISVGDVVRQSFQKAV